MHWLIAIIINLGLLALPSGEPVKSPQAWNAKSIIWQKVDRAGIKWAVLEGRSDLPGEAFTYAGFIPRDSTISTRTAATHASQSHRGAAGQLRRHR